MFMKKIIYRSVVTLALKKSVSQVSKNITFRHNPNYFYFYINNPVRSSRLFLGRLSMVRSSFQNIRVSGSNVSGYFLQNWRRARFPVLCIPVGYLGIT